MVTELDTEETVGLEMNPFTISPLTEVVDATVYEVPFFIEGELTNTTPL